MAASTSIEKAKSLLIAKDPRWDDHLLVMGMRKDSAEMACLMATYPFSVEEEEIVIAYPGEEVRVDRRGASLFWMAYHNSRTCAQYLMRLGELMFAPPYEYDFSVLQPEKKEEGQAKILLSFLEPFAGMVPKAGLNVLCIGAEGEGVSGLAYDPLAMFLGRIGFSGHFWLYAAAPSQRSEYQCGGFVMHVMGQKFCYTDMPDIPFDVILEDRYEKVAISFENERSASTPIPVRRGALRDGAYTFVVYETWDKKFRMKFWPSSKSTSHSSHGLDASMKGNAYKVLGGAHMIVESGTVHVVGTSLTYGHYAPGDLDELLVHYSRVHFSKVARGREAYDSTWALHYKYRDARITSKYFGEKVPVDLGAHLVRSQLYYEGHEQRILFRCPQLPEPDYKCCTAHRHMSSIASMLTSATDVPPFQAMNDAYMGVTRTYCSPFVGASSRAIRNRICAAARYQTVLGEAVSDIAKNLRVRPITVRRNVLALVKMKEVRLSRVDAPITPLDCREPEMVKGKLVYRSDCRTVLYDIGSGKYSDAEGEDMIAPVGRRVHLVRASTRSPFGSFGRMRVQRLLQRAEVSYRFVKGLGLHGKGKYYVDLELFESKYVVAKVGMLAPGAYSLVAREQNLVLYRRN